MGCVPNKLLPVLDVLKDWKDKWVSQGLLPVGRLQSAPEEGVLCLELPVLVSGPGLAGHEMQSW